jgi:hypothetical protein
VLLEGLDQLKKSVASSGIKPATFRLGLIEVLEDRLSRGNEEKTKNRNKDFLFFIIIIGGVGLSP